MKLLNNTTVPNEILEPLLTLAGRSVGARTSKVVVQVNRGDAWSNGCRGMAYECCWVRWQGGNKRRRYVNTSVRQPDGSSKYVTIVKNKPNRISTDGGAFKISLPVIPASCHKDGRTGPMCYNGLRIAENFMYVARHEWGHIRDYQDGGRYRLAWSRPKAGGRRAIHDRRPEEWRAENYIYDSDLRRKNKNWAYEEIMALALYLEGLKPVKKLD